ncbi:uncharacterized protein LOC100372273 [Saccoglossus kowalevskii]|uniref:Uncharacterized protein LOC100372273 n=1 Tax=Saccoglossus kowalevskii TaxID=10224 RepID=A0ABM0GQR7_SACKO|nr:PREDICTED: uncharacterized protein LOC100372273 [Saccoglossus kowalevskii]
MCDCRISNRTLRHIGISLIFLGLLSVVLGVMRIPLGLSPIKYASEQIWTGAFVAFTGVCSYVAGKATEDTRNKGWLTTFLVFSIITVIISFAGWCLAITAVADERANYHWICDPYDIWRDCDYYELSTRQGYTTSITLSSISVFLAFLECVLVFSYSIVACCAISRPAQATQHTVVYQPQYGQNVTVVQSGQQYLPAHGGQVYLSPGVASPGQPMQQPIQQPMVQYPPGSYPQQAPMTQPTAPPEYHSELPPSYDQLQTDSYNKY